MIVNKNTCAVCVLRKLGPGLTYVTNATSEQIKRVHARYAFCRIWARLNLGPRHRVREFDVLATAPLRSGLYKISRPILFIDSTNVRHTIGAIQLVHCVPVQAVLLSVSLFRLTRTNKVRCRPSATALIRPTPRRVAVYSTDQIQTLRWRIVV